MSFWNQRRTFLGKSIILEETGSTLMVNLIILFESFIVLSFLIWASLTRIDEVVVAPGEIVPMTQVHKVQHLAGGTIQAIYIHDGDRVAKDQVLLELDPKNMDDSIIQTRVQLQSLISQKRSLEEELELTQKMIESGMQSKYSILPIQRELAGIDGQIHTLYEQIRQYEQSKDKFLIKAPVSGLIHNLKVRSPGEIVVPNMTILEIIPNDAVFNAEIRISPADVGHLKAGQSVTIKIASYDYSRYGGIAGTLKEVSPGNLMDPEGNIYFKGIVSLSQPYIEKNMRRYPLISGMTLTSDLKIGSKTMMEYLLKPVFTSAGQSFRER